jgi:hypothetical protein
MWRAKLSSDDEAEPVEVSKACQKWTESQVKLLIATYENLKSKFDSPMLNNKQVWALISKNMEKEGVKKNWR